MLWFHLHQKHGCVLPLLVEMECWLIWILIEMTSWGVTVHLPKTLPLRFYDRISHYYHNVQHMHLNVQPHHPTPYAVHPS